MNTNAGSTSRADDHRCPGGCGADVRRHLLACRDCWARLPDELRQAVNRRGPGHVEALSDALTWYRDNPKEA